MKKTLLCIAVGLLSACGGDLKAPTKENFAKAAQAYLDTTPLCARIDRMNLSQLPSDVRINGGFFGTDEKPLTIEDAYRQDKSLKAFHELGFITIDIETRNEVPQNLPNLPAQAVTYAKIALTDKGKPFYRSSLKSWGSGAEFCYAKIQLVEIGQFTEPSDMRGVKGSRVSFTQKAVDVQDWASKPELGLEMALNQFVEPRKVTAFFVLTNEGWAHEKMFGR